MTSVRQPTRRAFLAAIASLSIQGREALAQEPGLSFLVIGDWGTGSAGQKRVATAMGQRAAAASARFVISTGDNFYPAGVASTDDPQWRASFEDIYDAPSLMIPWFAVLGNHDHRGNVHAQVAYTRQSPRWRMPSTFYRHSELLTPGTSADFFFIDTGPILRQHASWIGRFRSNEQIAWLERELAASGARWKFVVGHHPVHSGEPRKASPGLVEWLAPVLERHRVQVYLNGHSHNLEHIVIRGVHYLTSGAGSMPRKANVVAGTHFVRGGTLGFLIMRVSSDRVDIEFSDDLGNSLHQAKAA